MNPTANRAHLVKEVFEKPRRYFGGRQYDVRIRAETVAALAKGLEYRRVLDIGCGDGSISLPLLAEGKNLTLLDLSANMLSIVRSRVPEDLMGSVELRNEDFMKADLEPGSFDLVVCLGVMAHVDSPEQFLARVVTMMTPGASLILEFTDAFCLAGRLSRLVRAFREFIAPPRYPVNLLSLAQVSGMMTRQGLRPAVQFRYGLPPLPGIGLLNHEIRYKVVRGINGVCGKSRNQWWGYEYVCLLTLDPARNTLPHRPSDGRLHSEGISADGPVTPD
jgi:ubiquinone/menaquinone biosynthesis C-methylase UbiE